jgi:hypothetical protein
MRVPSETWDKLKWASAVSSIKRLHPDSDEIRHAGKCPNCKQRTTLYSYQLPGDHPRGKGEETCAYWCANCGWGNAGSRPSLDMETTE